MARPVTLFTGQWADLPLEQLAPKCAGWGFDGLELACWGDHFEVDKALSDSGYVDSRRSVLAALLLSMTSRRRAILRAQFHLPVARSPETILSRNQHTADRGSSAGGRRTWR